MTPSPARLTLGAIRPGSSYYSAGGVPSDPPYWIGCMTRTEESGEGGEHAGEPHCYFIKRSWEVTVFCPTCRPDRNEIRQPPPWGDTLPLWKDPGISEKKAAALEDWYQERAAIMEYDGGMSRWEAERAAYWLLMERMAQ